MSRSGRFERRAIPQPIERRTEDAPPRCPLCGVELTAAEVVFTSVSCWNLACANFDARRWPGLAAAP